MAQKTSKGNEIQYIIQKALKQKVEEQHSQEKLHSHTHLMRAVFIAIDMTESMHITDLKPSRFGVTVEMIRRLIKRMRDITPLCKFMIAKVENELCKPLSNFNFSENTLIQQLDSLRLKPLRDAGYFSLQNTISVALDYFDSVPSTYHKQMIVIQSSPFTKDYRDIYETISIFQQSRISISIASLVGWTFAFSKLVEACSGKYITIGSQKQFQDFISQIAENPIFNQDKVLKKLIKMSLGKRQYATENSRKMCFCHYEPVQQYFVCGTCSAILCEKMPMECAICMTTLVFPSDLYRHKI